MKSIKKPHRMVNWGLSLLFLGGINLPDSFIPQDRNVKKFFTAKDSSTIIYDKSYALVVGVSDYTNGWPDLSNAVKDAKEVAEALRQHNFQVTILENPSKNVLESAINDFIFTYGMAPNNRLLFYFAGHGHTMKRAQGMKWGYIVPADTPHPDRDQGGFRQKAISMLDIENFAKNIDARHALFIFDSCFSGTVFTQGRGDINDINIDEFRKPVRQFITAGDENEQVPDISIFKSQFIAGIKGEADLYGDGYITGTELGLFLSNKVPEYSPGQHPQYGKLRDPAFVKGEFFFKVIPDTTKIINGPEIDTPQPPPSEFGWLEILISYEADVYVDGILQAAEATKPIVLKLLPGLHKIKVRGKQGYFHKENFVIEAGKSHKIVPEKKL